MGRIPPRDRNIALVFQDYALYPHMRVRENIAFPLHQQKLPAQTIGKQVAWAAELLGLDAELAGEGGAIRRVGGGEIGGAEGADHGTARAAAAGRECATFIAHSRPAH